MPNSSSLLDDLLSCQTIKITLKNEVLSNMKAYHGIYKKSASINGKPSWKSQSKAIWFNQGRFGRYQWKVGNQTDTGKQRGQIYTHGMRSGSQYGAWQNGEIWKLLNRTANDFSIECLEGKGTIHISCLQPRKFE